MKQIVSIIAFLILAVTGCLSQVQQSPPVYNCPTPSINGTNYVPLNQTTPVSGNTYSETVTPGTYCNIVQSYRSSDKQVSVPSNVAVSIVGSGQNTILVSWTPPIETGLQFIVSRTTAVLVAPPGAPNITNQTVARSVKPFLVWPVSREIETPKIFALVTK